MIFLTILSAISLLGIFFWYIFLASQHKKNLDKAILDTNMAIARSIQTGILPKITHTNGLEVAAFTRPTELIGGDYYDIRYFNGMTWIMIGDVTGHGTGAGLVVLMVQSMMSSILYAVTLMYQDAISPAKLNYVANRALRDNLKRLNKDDVVTILTTCIEGNKLTYSGSHDSFFVHRKESNTVEIIKVDDFPIGLGFDKLPEDEIGQNVITVNPGDTILLTTDGLTEAPRGGNYHNGTFDENRVAEFIQENSQLSVETMKEKLVEEVSIFNSGRFLDDVCFIIIRVKE